MLHFKCVSLQTQDVSTTDTPFGFEEYSWLYFCPHPLFSTHLRLLPFLPCTNNYLWESQRETIRLVVSSRAELFLLTWKIRDRLRWPKNGPGRRMQQLVLERNFLVEVSLAFHLFVQETPAQLSGMCSEKMEKALLTCWPIRKQQVAISRNKCRQDENFWGQIIT